MDSANDTAPLVERLAADLIRGAHALVIEKVGPHACCADFAAVIVCDGEIDVWECPCCGTTWAAPCGPASVESR